jgi:hypothetical protein
MPSMDYGWHMTLWIFLYTLVLSLGAVTGSCLKGYGVLTVMCWA